MNKFPRNTVLVFSLLTLSTVTMGGEPQGVVVDISSLFSDSDEIGAIAETMEASEELQASEQNTVAEEAFNGIVVDIPEAVIIPSSAPPPSPLDAPEAVLESVLPAEKALPAVDDVIDQALAADAAGSDAAGSDAAVAAAADGTAAAAVNGEKKNILQTIGDAMRPKGPAPSLNNNRFSLYLSDRVVFAQYDRSAERYNLENGRTHLGLLYSEERDTVLQGGLAVDTTITKSFRLSFGARAYAAILGAENTDAVAVGPGVEGAYLLPLKALPLELAASIYFAPDILTFGAGDNVLDWQVDVTLPVREKLSVFTGLRFLQLDTRPNDAEIDNRLHFGVRWDFL